MVELVEPEEPESAVVDEKLVGRGLAGVCRPNQSGRVKLILGWVNVGGTGLVWCTLSGLAPSVPQIT